MFTKQALKRSEQNFVTKLNHDQHLNWGLYYMSMPNGLPPARSQGGAIGQSLKGSVLSNIRKLFTNQALEISEQNFVTKLNHDQHLNWGLYYMSMPNGLPPAWSQGGAIGQSLKGSVLSNIRKLFTNQALEISEQNFVTKLNHVPHLAWGMYCMSNPMGYRQPGPRGRYRSKSEGKCTIKY